MSPVRLKICRRTGLLRLKIVLVRLNTQNFCAKVKANDFKLIMSLHKANFSEDWVTAEMVSRKKDSMSKYQSYEFLSQLEIFV